MKKIKINQKVEEATKEREKKWQELRQFMEKTQETTPKPNMKIEPKQKPNEVDTILKEIGLERYSTLMKENGIDDLEILMEIQENHLEEMGIVLGHRLKILKKIRELSTPKDPLPVPVNNSSSAPKPRSNNLMSSKPSEKTSITKEEIKGILKETSPAPSKTSTLFSKDLPKPLDPQERSTSATKISKFIKTEEIFAIFSEKLPIPKPNTNEKPQIFKEQPKTSTLHAAPKTMKSQETFTDSNSSPRSVNYPILKPQAAIDPANNSKPPPKSENLIQNENSAVVQLSKPPIASKPATVGKNLALYQPTSQELEKEVKLSEIISNNEEVKKKDEFKWDAFSYIPYKPSEEIRAIPGRSSRPHSAKSEKIEKGGKSEIEGNKEKFDMVGWDN